MHRILILALSVASLAGSASPLLAEPLPKIFTGNDLSGWKVPEENVWWKAADGLLRVQSGPKQQGSTLWTEKEYENFIVELEFKMGAGTVDSGVFIRNGNEQIQIGISGSLKRDMTASPYISGKGYPVEAEGVAEILQQDEWNAMTIVAKGPSYVVWLNGKLVMTYVSESAAERGPIGIQLHGNREMAIEYRDIRAAELR